MTSMYDVLKASKGVHVDDTFAELWGRKLSNAYTVATYTGTLPATLQTAEGYLESYKIYGNTEQAGTPTPENPIVPSGCGERTKNLIAGMLSGTIGAIGNIVYSSEYVIYYAPVTAGETYTISGGYYVYAYYADKPVVGVASAVDNERHFTAQGNTITAISGASWVGIRTDSGNIPMLNEGSTALPYEPYGYKLPLTANGVEYPIYLGEVETTRKVKKLVLTGEEDWSRQSVSHTTCINLYTAITYAEPSGVIISNVATYNSNAGLSNDSIINVGRINNIGTNLLMDMELSKFATASAWKTYLREQYANGTPVTIWYVLAEPKTAVVNEPLMKIGDYADTIDSTQSTVQIPTAAGETTISWAGEGLAPSEVELTYRKSKGQ